MNQYRGLWIRPTAVFYLALTLRFVYFISFFIGWKMNWHLLLLHPPPSRDSNHSIPVLFRIPGTRGKLLLYYHFKLKTTNYRQKIDKFIVSFSRYKGVSPMEVKMIQKRWPIFHFELKQIFTNLYI